MGFSFNPLTGKLDISGDSKKATTFVVSSVTTSTPGAWEAVPSPDIENISDVQVFDELNMEKVEVDVRIIGQSQAEIRSNKIKTFTVHVEGY